MGLVYRLLLESDLLLFLRIERSWFSMALKTNGHAKNQVSIVAITAVFENVIILVKNLYCMILVFKLVGQIAIPYAALSPRFLSTTFPTPIKNLASSSSMR